MTDPNDLTFDDHLKMIEANRTRVRSLGTIIGTACSFLLTASSAFLAYIYKGDTGNQVSKNIRYPVSLSILLAGVALALVVWAFVLRKPTSVPNREALITYLAFIYREEQKRVRLATIVLAGAIAVFMVGFNWFAWTVEPKTFVPAAPTSTTAATAPTIVASPTR